MVNRNPLWHANVHIKSVIKAESRKVSKEFKGNVHYNPKHLLVSKQRKKMKSGFGEITEFPLPLLCFPWKPRKRNN